MKDFDESKITIVCKYLHRHKHSLIGPRLDIWMTYEPTGDKVHLVSYTEDLQVGLGYLLLELKAIYNIEVPKYEYDKS